MKFCWNGNGEQEGEEDLDAGQGDAQLLQQLAEVAIEAFGLALVPSRRAFLHLITIGEVSTSIVLFNRDLRVRDNPALAAAAKAERTVPLFVLDPALLESRFAAPNRVAFLLESLRDLGERLRRAGGRLYIRQGDPVREALALARECGAGELHVSADWSAFAQRREECLRRACEEQRIAFRAHPGTTIVSPGTVTPGGGDHFKVFSPFHRAWEEVPSRPLAPVAAAAWRCHRDSRWAGCRRSIRSCAASSLPSESRG